MTACDHVRPDLGGYVLGGLEPAEEAAVREHLATCADCSAEHARLAGLPALLSLAGRLEDAPGPAPAVEERVLDAIARERGPSRRRSLKLGGRNWSPRVLVPAGLAAVALIVAAIALTGGEEQAPAPAYQVQLRPTPGSAARGSAALDSVSGRHLAQAGHPGPAARPRHGLRGRVRRPQGHRERRHLPRRRQGPRLRGPHHRRAPRRVRRHPRRPPPQAARVRRPDRHPELGAQPCASSSRSPSDWCSRWPAAAGATRTPAAGVADRRAPPRRPRPRRPVAAGSSSRWPRPQTAR